MGMKASGGRGGGGGAAKKRMLTAHRGRQTPGQYTFPRLS